jgi:hypothetical protein
MESLIKYLIAVAKLQTDEVKATEAIEKKLKELINSELGACVEITEEQIKEWGDTSRCSKWTAEEIATKIKARFHKVD